ncbi:CLUMA_CG017735, isoform A [Clunio marinus]|uniref:CLUMA_CG017735, isoform A n=1 Tax=Clunio marinus TaxID=568069 RepID=A0A1J1IWZ1_9DIPT|nr:CLUMA_CG017735, isoform A [Clunio marinus]
MHKYKFCTQVHLPSQLFHCLSAIIAVWLCTNERFLVTMCKKMISCVGCIVTNVNAVRKLAWESFCLEAITMNKFVLFKNMSNGRKKSSC